MDPLLNTCEYALNGLQLRLDTVANNIANVNTPGFTAQKVNFESTLAAALRDGGSIGGRASMDNSKDLVDHTGNSVSLENELTEMTKSSLERQVMVSGFNYKIDLLKAAVGTAR